MEKCIVRTLTEQLALRCPADMELDTSSGRYVRRFTPAQRLIILGCGHISQALCRMASLVDFSVTVADDRIAFANSELFPDASEIICDSFQNAIEQMCISDRDYVAVMTRGHRWDADCLRAIFRGAVPEYLGLIGSRRRVRGLFEMLAEEDIDRQLIDHVSTPIGLEIHAVTPAEIAVSVVAEMILHRRTAKPAEGVLDQQTVDPRLLSSLQGCEPLVLAVVVETRGSVPVDTGAAMTIDKLGRIAGTVGGGCGEAEVIRAARTVFRSGRGTMLELDMTAEVAEEEGMVCGGRMKIWLEPIPED